MLASCSESVPHSIGILYARIADTANVKGIVKRVDYGFRVAIVGAVLGYSAQLITYAKRARHKAI